MDLKKRISRWEINTFSDWEHRDRLVHWGTDCQSGFFFNVESCTFPSDVWYRFLFLRTWGQSLEIEKQTEVVSMGRVSPASVFQRLRSNNCTEHQRKRQKDRQTNGKTDRQTNRQFQVAITRRYTLLCRSVGPSIGLSRFLISMEPRNKTDSP